MSANALLNSLLPQSQEGENSGAVVKRALQAIRVHLGMQVAYVSEFVDNDSVFREVDAPGLEEIIKAGDSRSLDDVYCRHILAGRIPELMPDTAAVPFAAAMPITQGSHIGKHMSVPIRLPDGSPYGMFCCLGFEADHSLQQRDLQMMRAFADLAAFEINRDRAAKEETKEKQARVMAAIDEHQITIVYQPIWDVETREPIGFESLARFSAAPSRTPDRWFADAAETGLGVTLELAAIRMALKALARLPAHVYLAVNASPQTILSEGFADILADWPAERIVLEITEHADVEDYALLMATLMPIRKRGIRLAIDDAGAGYSSLRHILDLQPDLIKLDMSLTRNIGLDPARKALAAALTNFASETGSKIIAEGVETASEFATLRALGVQKAQGYFLARPMPLEDAVALFARDAQVAAVG